MKRRLFCLLLLLLAGCIADPLQAQTAYWVRGMRDSVSNANSYSEEVCTDGLGSAITCGRFYGRVDFNPLLPVYNITAGSSSGSGFVQKLDSNGVFLWTGAFIGPLSVEARGVAVDAANNVYVAGQYTSGFDMDPGPGTFAATTQSAGSRGFIVKLSPTGSFLWGKDIGTNGSTVVVRGLDVSPSGEIVICGSATGIVDFDPGPTVWNLPPVGNGDSYVLRLDASGNYLWGKRYGSSGEDQATRVKFDRFNNLVIAGYYIGPFDADPGPSTYTLQGTVYHDVYASKLDPSGNFLWAARWGDGQELDLPSDLEVAQDGAVYISYDGPGAQDLDPGPGSVYHFSPNYPWNDAFVVKLSPAGTYLWSYALSGPNHEAIGAIGLSQRSELYLSGLLSGTYDVDPGPGTLTLSGNPVLVLDSMGALLDGFSPLVSVASCIDISPWGKAYFTGLGCSTISDFDPGPAILNTGAIDNIWIWCWRACLPRYSSVYATACSTYTLNNATYTQSGNYLQYLPATTGCDSILTLHLNLLGSQAGSTSASGCSSVTVNGQTYTASGTYSQTLTASNGCDSILTVNATILPTTYGQVAESSCSTVTVNGILYSSSGSYQQTLTNSHGCDSILTVLVTIFPATSGQINATGCNSATVNGMTYTATGTYTQHLTNVHGCDSTLTVNVQLLPPTQGSTTASGCDVVTVNGQSYSTSGSYTQTLQNSNGCDSILTVQVSIIQLDTAVIDNGQALVAQGVANNYQWLNCGAGFLAIPGANSSTFTPGAVGTYAVALQGQGCTDTSACHLWDPLSIEMGHAVAVQVWPNPSLGMVHLAWNDVGGASSVEVYDARGVLVQRLMGNGANCVLHLPTSGVYLVRIQTADGRAWSGRVIRE
ncbi:MAG: T9SS type A sorting domain-containing protein [Bacteroidia bacterium]